MSFIIFLLIFSWWTRYVQVWIWRLLLVHKLLFTTRELWFILLDPICKTYFYILIALVLKADILDCYIPRSFFFSIPDFKWMFWITKVFVCSSCLSFWHYTHTSIFLNLFTNFNQTKVKGNQNCSNGGLIICTPTRTTVLQYVISHTYNSCILVLGRFNLFKPSWLQSDIAML